MVGSRSVRNPLESHDPLNITCLSRSLSLAFHHIFHLFRVFPLANRPKYLDRHFGTTLNVKETCRLMPMPELSSAARSSPSPSGWTWRTWVTGVTRVWRRILSRIAESNQISKHGWDMVPVGHWLIFCISHWGCQTSEVARQANWHPMKVIEGVSPTISKSPEFMHTRHQKRMRTSSSFSLDWAQHSWANSQDWLGGAGHGSGWRIMKNFLTQRTFRWYILRMIPDPLPTSHFFSFFFFFLSFLSFFFFSFLPAV